MESDASFHCDVTRGGTSSRNFGVRRIGRPKEMMRPRRCKLFLSSPGEAIPRSLSQRRPMKAISSGHRQRGAMAGP
jgi:hypothetical protein